MTRFPEFWKRIDISKTILPEKKKHKGKCTILFDWLFPHPLRIAERLFPEKKKHRLGFGLESVLFQPEKRLQNSTRADNTW